MEQIETHLAVLGGIAAGHNTLDALRAGLALDSGQVAAAAKDLLLCGWICRAEDGRYSIGAQCRAALEPAIKAPLPAIHGEKKDSFERRAWAAMRRLKRFTSADIAILACKKGQSPKTSQLMTYIKQLRDGGYVMAQAKRGGETKILAGLTVYRLIKDTGPLAPLWSKGRLAERNG